ncbi:MAG: hypothetical protein OJF52_002401 [Nitrospira sp.]|nr:MAG: hypothetical protein OJF52_002401 [Nitrospira sp.]
MSAYRPRENSRHSAHSLLLSDRRHRNLPMLRLNGPFP